MRLEVIFLVKKQRKLEINSVKSKLSIILKEKEEKGSLTNREKNVLKNKSRYAKNIVKHLKNFRKHLKKLRKYHYGLDYLLTERNEEDYTTEPTASNNDISAIEEARKLFNDRRSNLSRKEINEIREKTQ